MTFTLVKTLLNNLGWDCTKVPLIFQSYFFKRIQCSHFRNKKEKTVDILKSYFQLTVSLSGAAFVLYPESEGLKHARHNDRQYHHREKIEDLEK